MKAKTEKGYVEKINALKQELREMLDNCKKEVRALNSDEKEMFDKKEQEIRDEYRQKKYILLKAEMPEINRIKWRYERRTEELKETRLPSVF